jgi:long-chain acyl-CoA synthetase
MDLEAARRERAQIDRAVDGQTVCTTFQATVAARGAAPAMMTKRGASWVATSWSEYGVRVRDVACGLAALGVAPGRAVALLSAPREDYNVLDLAITHCGGVPVALYPTLAPGQIAYIVNHAESVLAVAENGEAAERFLKLRGELVAVEALIVVDDAAAYRGDPWILSLDDVIARGRAAGVDFDSLWRRVRPDDLATLIYTSGTTGPPKGVMLSHRNICWTQESARRAIDSVPGERMVAYLPVAHVAERSLSLWGAVSSARTVYFCPSIDRLAETLVEVRPQVFFSVPRVWEKMHAGMRAALASDPSPERRGAVHEALAAALGAVALEQVGEPVPAEMASTRARADAAIFPPLRARLGLDAVRVAVSGAAPIAPEVLQFFHAIGIEICEVYGQSEDCGPTSINRPGAVRIGSVGLPYPGVEVHLEADGEILVRGGNVFRGYFKEPELTAATLTEDGWLRSGDIGVQDPDGYLRVVDRKKDIIVTAGGKNITPSNLEHALRREPLVSQVMLVGDRRPYCTALITLDEAVALGWARAQGLAVADYSVLLERPELQAWIQAAVDRVNAEVARVEQIRRFAILPTDWTPGGDELTPTLKVRRRVVDHKYQATIDAMYAAPAAGDPSPAP